MTMLGDKPFEGWASGYDNDVYIEPESENKAEYDLAVAELLLASFFFC